MSPTRCLTAAALTLLLTAAPLLALGADIAVDTSRQYQTIEGFGTCIVSWVPRMQQLYRTPEFQKVYVEDLRFNMMRVNLWGPVCPQPIKDWHDIRWQDFDMTVDGGRSQIFLDFGTAICKLNPQEKLIGTVWSPPPWMKETGRVNDTRSGAIRADSYGKITNRVKPGYYMHFAKWICEMVKMHRAAGAPLYAVSPGNEVQFTQTFESCVWTGPDLARIIAILGKMLKDEGLDDVKIYAPETMTSHDYAGGTPDYVRDIMADPEAANALDVFATHGYADNGFTGEMSANSSRKFWNLIKGYGKPFWITEGGTGGHNWPEPLQNGVATGIHNALVAGNVSAYVPWQVIDTSPNTHDLMVYSRSGQITYTPKTYAVLHYSRFIAPGAVRVDASPAYGDVEAGAFRHPVTGALTIVLLNPGAAEQPVSITFRQDPGVGSMQLYRTSATEGLKRLPDVAIEGGRLALSMPAQSMVTLYSPGKGN
jgi:glucuronoarabinoxylan endo-1,4-beta-xylanase